MGDSVHEKYIYIYIVGIGFECCTEGEDGLSLRKAMAKFVYSGGSEGQGQGVVNCHHHHHLVVHSTELSGTLWFWCVTV